MISTSTGIVGEAMNEPFPGRGAGGWLKCSVGNIVSLRCGYTFRLMRKDSGRVKNKNSNSEPRSPMYTFDPLGSISSVYLSAQTLLHVKSLEELHRGK